MTAFSGRESEDSSRQPRANTMIARASSAVIAFPTDRVRPASREAGKSPGEVVIFSGVRIERMTDEPLRLPKQGQLLPPRPRRGRRQG